MNYDIGISYIEDIPEHVILDFVQELDEANVTVNVESRPNEPFMAFEWAIPAAIIAYLAKPYIDGLLKEAAKDHYAMAKEKLSKFAQRISKVKQIMIVSSLSPNKLRKDNPVSNSFSIWSETIDGRPLKFLFFGDRDDDYYECCIDKVFSVLLNHAKEFPNYYISDQADRLPRKSREIYLLFDESAKMWKPVEIVTGILADDSDAL